MDWLTFISSIIASLGWPAAVLAIVLLLRRPLAKLIPLLQKLKLKDLELEFRRGIEEAEIKADAVLELPPSAEVEALSSPIQDRVLELARVSPVSAVIDAWLEVEAAAREALVRNNVSLRPREGANPINTIRALQRAGLVDKGQVSIFHDLRVLRNKAVHTSDFDLSSESAIEYAALAQLFSRVPAYSW